MNALKRLFDVTRPHFENGGKLARLHPLFDAIETVAFTPALTTAADTHVRDSLDLKRFILISLVSRSARFFMVGSVIFLFGETAKTYVAKYMNTFSLAFVVLLIVGFLAIRYLAKRLAVKE